MSEMTVEDAESEALEAEKLAVTLEERVRDGDESVSPDELAEAERLGKFARLRVEAAQRKATARRRASALQRGEAFVAELRDQTQREDADLVEAWVTLVDAMRAVQAVGDARRTAVREASDRRQSFDALLRRDAGVELAELGALPSYYGNEVGYQVPAAGIRVADVTVAQIVAAAASLGLDGTTRSSLTGLMQMDPITPTSTLADRVAGWPAAVAELDERD